MPTIGSRQILIRRIKRRFPDRIFVIDRGETGTFMFEDWMIVRSGTMARDQARRSRISDVAGNRHSPRLVMTQSADAAAINDCSEMLAR